MYDMVHEHGYVELLEGHVKALKSKYFFERAHEADDENTSNSYSVLSAVNYAWYKQLMEKHIELYGIEMDEDTLEEMLDTYSPEDVVKALSEGATREPDRCVDGGYGYAAKSGNKNNRRNNDSKANSKIGRAALMVERVGDYFKDDAADDAEGNEDGDANKRDAENDGEGNGEQGSSDGESSESCGDSE